MNIFCCACGMTNSKYNTIEKKYSNSRFLVDFLICEFTCESCLALNKVEIHSKKYREILK